ncbi:hypothetical protein [Nostoc sp.]|uniref:hypothetical protein n=1 Tax=Nostoc sp. TaxID=1180 RepID=UPI002FFD56C5
MNIDPLERAIAFLLWGGIALLVKGVIVFWEVGQKAITGQNEINRLERAITFIMWRRQSRFHQRSDRTPLYLR